MVAVGCDVPEKVSIASIASDVRIVAKEVDTEPECFAPITTVALVTVDA